MKLWQSALNERQRKFARDVGSVVLGVLIALGIGEVAEAIRWEVRANTAERAMREELARNAGVFEERDLVQPCIDRRLRELNAIVAAARRSGSLPLLGEIGRPPQRPIEEAAWNVSSGSETLLHIDNQRRTALSGIYAQMSGNPNRAYEEQEMWATLRLLENAPGPISDDLLAETAAALARLQYVAFINGLNAQQLLGFIKGENIQPSYFTIFDRDGQREELLAANAQRPICKPLQVREQPTAPQS